MFSFLRYFPADEFSVFTLLDTPISLCMSGNLLYFSIYISLVSVVTIYFPVLFVFDSNTVVAISFYHISFLSCTVYLSLLPLLYSLMIPKLYSYTSLLHIYQHVLFVFYFLLCLNSHLSLYSFLCGHFLICSRMGYS